jgi:hypothetical protein
MHPRNSEDVVENKDGKITRKTFSIFGKIGSFGFMKCCASDTTPMAKEIGIGATMFLMTTKSLSWFFLILTIINLPLFAFYG